MNKTVTINLSGIVFHIDEDAFDILKIYLEKIKSYFAQNEGRDEIMNDIEYRIAEIFQSKINDRNQVIVTADIDEVVGILGKPEDFGESAEGTSESKSTEPTATPKHRRLYRDTENSVLGGVCNGLGHYFDVDPVWFRLAFVLALFIFSTGILIYIILWIIIPKANTIAEKYEMRGEKVNISDIEKNIKEQIDCLKKRLGEIKKDAKGKSKVEFEQLKQKLNDLKSRQSNPGQLEIIALEIIHHFQMMQNRVFQDLLIYSVPLFIILQKPQLFLLELFF